MAQLKPILPGCLTGEPFLHKLRAYTAQMESRLERALESLFSTSILPWEEWFVAAMRSEWNRAALGVPAHIDQHEIVRMIGGHRGLSEAIRETVAVRLCEMLATLNNTLDHPLCCASLQAFRHHTRLLLSDLSQHLRWERNPAALQVFTKDWNGPEAESKKWEACWRRMNGKGNLKGPARALAHQAWCRLEEKAGPYAHSFHDPVIVVLLEMLAAKRWQAWQAWADRHEYDHSPKDPLLQNMILTIEPHRFTSPIVRLWYLAELVWHMGGQDGPKAERVRRLVSSAFDNGDGDIPRVLSAGRLPEPRRVSKRTGLLREFEDYGCVKYLLSASSALILQAYRTVSAEVTIAHDKHDPQGVPQDRLEALLWRVYAEPRPGDMDDEEVGLVWRPDDGHLYLMSLRLFALEEFWRWHTANLLVSDNASRGCARVKIGAMSFYKTMLADPGTKEDTTDGRQLVTHDRWNAVKAARKSALEGGYPSGTKHSVMLLGGGGIGKTELMRQLYGIKEGNSRFMHLTPVTLQDTRWEERFKACRADTQYCVMFVDELHLPTSPSVFAQMLVPLQNGVDFKPLRARKPKRARVQYVFATSRWRTRQEFEASAYRDHDVPMRDFATRIGQWFEFPGLNTMPEQRLVVCGTLLEVACGGEDPRFRVYLDLALGSVRKLTRTLGGTMAPPESNPYFPGWLVERLKPKAGQMATIIREYTGE